MVVENYLEKDDHKYLVISALQDETIKISKFNIDKVKGKITNIKF